MSCDLDRLTDSELALMATLDEFPGTSVSHELAKRLEQANNDKKVLLKTLKQWAKEEPHAVTSVEEFREQFLGDWNPKGA